MNGDVLELLGLDTETVLAAASATEDYAERGLDVSIGDTDLQDAGMRVASAYTVSGSLWSLVDPERGSMLFSRAGLEYTRSGSPWATVPAICGNPRAHSRGEEWNLERPLLEHPQPEALLLSHLWPVSAVGETGADELSRLLDVTTRAAQNARALPLGRMRIPLAHYLEVGWAIFRLRQGHDDAPANQDRLLNAMTAFLARAGEATSAARADRYHWSMLRSGLLPLEPEATAVSALASMTWRDVVGEPFSEMLAERLRPADLAPLLVAERIVDSSDEERMTPA